jgi:hypothetical protein
VDGEADGVQVLRTLALLVLAGCTSSSIVVAPVVDQPTNASASAFPLDTMLLEVAHAGDSTDLESETFTSGETVELSGVPFGDDLVIHMTGDVGQSEVAYGRTCEFAVSASSQPAVAPHLFFSRSVKFADTSLMPDGRDGGAAIADQHGAGMIVGGVDPSTGTPVTDVERFDPTTGDLLVIGTVEPRTGAVAAALDESGIALIGGLNEVGAEATFIEVIDPDQPEARRVDEIDDTVTGRTDLTATELTTGDVIVIGGQAAGSASNEVDDLSIANGTASAITLHTNLAYARYDHTATRLGSDEGAPVLVAGGIGGSGAPVAAAELYKPLSQDFSATFMASMVVPRSQHQAVVMPDNSVLVIGGVDGSGNGVDTLELFSLDSGFVSVGTLPTTAGLVGFTATTLPDGRVLLIGGSRALTGPGATPLSTAFIASLDPIDGSVDVVATDNLSVPRVNHQATLLCDGTVLVSGGTDSPQIAERYNPPPAGRR